MGEELFEPSHEHLLIGIGCILIVNAIEHTQEGIYKITHDVFNKEYKMLNKFRKIFEYTALNIVLGITIIITSIYGIYEDIEKIHSKSISIGLGIITLLLPVINTYQGSKKLSKGLQKNKHL